MKDKIVKIAGTYKTGATKTRLATRAGISYSACSVAVNELVADGLLTPTGQVRAGSGRGRPATKFSVA